MPPHLKRSLEAWEPVLAIVSALVVAMTSVKMFPLWWTQVVDFHVFVPAGYSLISGDLTGVYDDERNAGGPAWLALVGWIAHTEMWQFGYWMLTALFLIAFSALLIVVGLELGIAARLRVMLFLLGQVALATSGMAKILIQQGHWDHLVVFTCWVIAAYLLHDAHTVRKEMVAATLLGLAVWWEPWAVLGLPILFFSPFKTLRFVRLGAVLIGVAAVGWLPFVMSRSFQLGELHWGVNPGTIWSLVGVTEMTWPLRLVQACMALVMGLIAVWAIRSRAAIGAWFAGTLVAAALILVRLAVDPRFFGYYVLVASVALWAIWMLLLVSRQWLAATACCLAVLSPNLSSAFGVALGCSVGALAILATAGLARSATPSRTG